MKKQEITKIIKKLKACDPIIVNWVDAGDDEPPVTGLVWKSMNKLFYCIVYQLFLIPSQQVFYKL